MFSNKKGINDKNDKIFQSNLTLYKLDQSTKNEVRTLILKTPLKPKWLLEVFNSLDEVVFWNNFWWEDGLEYELDVVKV